MRIDIPADNQRWYVIYTNQKQEDRAYENLRAWGVETLHAKLRVPRYNQFTGAPVFITQPLFPRYIFAKFDVYKQLPKVRFTRGVQDVICFGDGPVSVDQEIIDIILERMDENGFVKTNDELKLGDKVVISAGPLRDLMGIFEREIKGTDRISILLTAIEYQGRLEITRNLVKRAAG